MSQRMTIVIIFIYKSSKTSNIFTIDFCYYDPIIITTGRYCLIWLQLFYSFYSLSQRNAHIIGIHQCFGIVIRLVTIEWIWGKIQIYIP